MWGQCRKTTVSQWYHHVFLLVQDHYSSPTPSCTGIYRKVPSFKTSCFCPSIMCPILITSNMWPPTPCAGIHEGGKDVLCVYNPSIPQIRSTTMFAFTLLVAIRLSSYQHPLHVQQLFYQFHVHRAAATHVTAHVTFNTVGSGAMPLCILTRVWK